MLNAPTRTRWGGPVPATTRRADMEHGSYDACEYYRRALVTLAQRARDAGVVLTLENEPLRPLAMGHYCQHAEARQAREVYAKPPETPETPETPEPLPLARPGRW